MVDPQTLLHLSLNAKMQIWHLVDRSSSFSEQKMRLLCEWFPNELLVQTPGIVHYILLIVPFCNKSSLVFVHFPIFIEFRFKNPFYSNCLHSRWQLSEFLYIILYNCFDFSIHDLSPFATLHCILICQRIIARE